MWYIQIVLIAGDILGFSNNTTWPRLYIIKPHWAQVIADCDNGFVLSGNKPFEAILAEL